MASLFKQRIVEWILDGERVPKGTPGAQPRRRKSRKWYGEYRDHHGKVVRIPLAESRPAAEKMLADAVRLAEDIAAGRTTEQQAKFGHLPLKEHLEAWRNDLRSRGNSPKHVKQNVSRVQRIIDWCDWTWPTDVLCHQAQMAIANNVRGASTRSAYVREAKSFSKWLVKRIGRDLFIDLAKPSVSKKDYERRPLEDQELIHLLEVTAASETTFRGLTGSDRYYLYLTACMTGYRVQELAALYPANFCLDENPPVVVLSGEDTKNERLANQPLNQGTAQVLGEWLATRPHDQKVWSRSWWRVAARMLRIDLKAAGIEPVIEGPTGKLHVDFHALRHTMINMLDRAGVSLKEAMQLARHSDPRLTMAIYGRSGLRYLGQAVDKMPDLTKQQQSKEKKQA